MIWTWLETHAWGQGAGSKEPRIPPGIFSSVRSQKPFNPTVLYLHLNAVRNLLPFGRCSQLPTITENVSSAVAFLYATVPGSLAQSSVPGTVS